MHLILIRHGRPEVVRGDTDPVLCEEGRSQAERLGKWLVRENIGRLVSSPLRRSLETAEPTRRILGLDVEILPGLSEVRSTGEGYRGVAELRKDPAGWARFLADPIGFFGEDPVAFKRDVLQAVGSLFDAGSDGKIAVFTHGLPINVVLSHALGVERVSFFLPHFCSLTRIDGSSLNDLNLESINETGHLAETA